MVYIYGIKLKKKKTLFISLTKIYGLGKKSSIKICKLLGYSKFTFIENLSKDQLTELITFLEKYKLTNFLKKSKYLSIKNLIDIKSYRGLRLIKGLPVRGQRTRTNATTCKKIKHF